MDLQELIRDTLEKTRSAVKGLKPEMTKGFTTPSNLQGYNLQEPAKQLVPLMSPFQKTLPRIVKAGANSDHWRTITSLSQPRMFSGARAAGYQFATNFAGAAEDGSAGPLSLSAAFKVAALQGFVDLEAQKASESFDDALAKETSNTLLNAMRIESQALMGATLTAIATPAAPTLSLATTAAPFPGGGAGLTAGTTSYFARIAALNIFAANRRSLDTINCQYNATNNEVFLNPPGITLTQLRAITCLQADGTIGTAPVGGGSGLAGAGIGIVSAEGTASLTPTAQALKISWTAVPGAAAYAVFVGTTTGLANLGLQCIVTGTQVCLTTLKAVGDGTAVAANGGTGATAMPTGGTADGTADTQAYDGIINQLIAGASGAYLQNVNGILTATATTGEITQLQDAMAAIYSQAKIGEFRIVVSGIDSRLIAAKGVVSNSMQIFAQPSPSGRPDMTIGAHVGQVINATTGDICEVQVDPWLPQGTILILPTRIPYPNANTPAPFQWVGSYDWMRWDYASTTTTGPVYPFDVRCNGVLEAIFTGGCGLLYNIWKG